LILLGEYIKQRVNFNRSPRADHNFNCKLLSLHSPFVAEKISTALPNRPVYKDIRRDPPGNEGWIKSKFIATLTARTTVFDLKLLVWRTSQEWSPLSAMSGIRMFAVVLTFLYDRRAFRIPVDAPRSPRQTPYNSTPRENLGNSFFSSDQIW